MSLDPQLSAAARVRRNRQRPPPLECRYINLCSQSRLIQADRALQIHIQSLTPEISMWRHLRDDEQIAGLAAARMSAPLHPHPAPILHARRNPNVDRLNL